MEHASKTSENIYTCLNIGRDNELVDVVDVARGKSVRYEGGWLICSIFSDG